MATISIASDKGGPGKTTTAILLGAELTLDGYRTRIIDTDINQQAAAFASKAKIPGFSVTGDVNESNILTVLRQAESGGGNRPHRFAGGLVDAGAQGAAPLAFCPGAVSGVHAGRQGCYENVRSDRRCSGAGSNPIARAMVWTRLMPGFESVPVRTVRAAVEGDPDVRIFKTALMERAAYRDIHISGMVPKQKDPTSGPAMNVAALTAELLEIHRQPPRGRMNDKPVSLAEEIQQARRPRVDVKLPPRKDPPDDAIEARSRAIGEKWGSSTQIVPKAPETKLESLRLDIPDYLARQLRIRCAEEKVTNAYLVMKALAKDGFEIDARDLVPDHGYKRKRG